MLHGFGGDPSQPHLVAVCTALAGGGVAALRFAYRDHRPPRMTLASALEDARGALRLLRAHPAVNAGRLAVVGFSFGGAVAALLAGEEKRMRAAVLAAATSNGEGKHAPLHAITKTRARVLLLRGSDDTVVSEAHAERFVLAASQAGVAHELRTIPGADHDFGPGAPTRERMATIVSTWVRESL